MLPALGLPTVLGDAAADLHAWIELLGLFRRVLLPAVRAAGAV